MAIPMSGPGRRRRRFAVAAAGAAAAVGAALLSAPAAQAAPALPEPNVTPAMESPSQSELISRVVKAMAADEAGRAKEKASLSTSGKAGSGIDAKIIGGTTTTISAAPWMAQLHYYDPYTDEGFFCGGVVVAPTKILTAAHCVKGYNWYLNGAVVTGATQLPSADGDLHGGTATAVWRQWNNPTYNAATIDNDIALLTLPVPVKATPLRMTTAGDTASYAAGTNAGSTGGGAPPPPTTRSPST